MGMFDNLKELFFRRKGSGFPVRLLEASCGLEDFPISWSGGLIRQEKPSASRMK